MFAEEEEWNDDPEAKALTKKVISRTNVSDSASVTPKGVGKKKSLLRTLQTLGPVPKWSKSDSLPQGAGNDSETETLPTPHTKRKKKRSKRGRKKVSSQGEEAGQKDSVGVKEEAPGPIAKNQMQSKEPVKAGFKKVKNLTSIPGSSKPDSKSIKDQEKDSVDSKIETLNRKQWRNKMKNKKKCKNKFKVQNGENSPKNAKAETIETAPRIALDVNSGNVVTQPQQPPSKNNKPQQSVVKAQKRKIVPNGKEMTFIKTASNPDTETVQNNKNNFEKNTKQGNQVKAVPLSNSKSPHIELKKDENKHQKAVREVQQLGPPGSKRRKQEESKVQDRRKEKLRRILGSQSSERMEQPIEQEKETHTIEQVPTDRSTALRSRMEHRLESARFRYINEVLYTTSSGEAKRMFRQDPQAFGVYHKGFTAQVKRWPVNPVDAIISYICQKPASLVVADFGCGDCKIALSVKNKVHSFDLAPISDCVTVCDMANVPLKNGTVDIAVFCLSLMGTNLVDFLLEANRVLVMGGVLKIAEVASRFENVRNFMSALSSLGFKLLTKDTDNSYFYSFEFEKIAEAPERVKKAGGLELRPCVYKKR